MLVLAELVAIALYLTPLGLTMVARSRRSRALWEYALDIPLVVAIDLLAVMLLARFVRLELAVLISRPVWGALGAAAIVRGRRAGRVAWPEALRRRDLGIVGACTAMAIALSTYLSRTCLYADRAWHIPLVASLRGQRIPFANVYEPGGQLAYHYAGDVFAAMFQILSFDSIHSARALTVAHDVAFGLTGASVALLLLWLGYRNIVAIAGLVLSMLAAGPLAVVDGGKNSVDSGYNFPSYLKLSYRPHHCLSGLLMVGFVGAIMARLRAGHDGGAREPPQTESEPPVLATALPLVAVTAALVLTDEASVGLLGLSLGFAWLCVKETLHPKRLGGLAVLGALLAAVVLPIVLIGGLFAPGVPAHHVTIVPWRSPGFNHASVPLSELRGLRLLLVDLAPMLAATAIGVVVTVQRRTRDQAAGLAFYGALLVISTVLLTHLDVDKLSVENHRFMSAAVFLFPLLLAYWLARGADRASFSLAAFAPVAAIVALGLSSASSLDWLFFYAKGRCTSPATLGSKVDLLTIPCREQSVSPGESARPTYVPKEAWYHYAGCHPIFSSGPPANHWTTKIGAPRYGTPAFEELDHDMVRPDQPLAVVCPLATSDPVCVFAQKRGRCRPLDPRTTTCELDAAERTELLASADGAKPAPPGAVAPSPGAPALPDIAALLHDDDALTLTSLDDVQARREALVTFLWGPAGMPVDKLPESVTAGVPNPFPSAAMTNLKRVDRLVIAMDQGIQNEAFHFVPETPNGRLVIVHGGHDYPPLDKTPLGPVVAALVAEGYGVLAAQMPCYTAIPCPNFPRVSPHDYLLTHVQPPSGSPLKYLVEHLVVSLHYLKTQSEAGGFAPYHDFAMTGLSGGGWTTTLYAALDPTITSSFPCSGGKPMYLSHCTGKAPRCLDGYNGDAEQMYFPLYKHLAGYLDLYAMGAAGAGRKQVQVQIRHDSCCFGQDQYHKAVAHRSWNQAVRAYEQKIQHFLGAGGEDHGSYRFEIDETAAHSHVISPTTLAQVILGELDGDRLPLAATGASAIYAGSPDDEVLSYSLPTWARTAFPMVGTPAVVESSNGTEIFFRDTQSSLVHVHGQSPGGPFTSESFKGTLASDPAAVVIGDVLHVVAVGATSKLTHWSRKGSDPLVTEVADTVTPVVGRPALLASKDGSLDVLVRRLDGGVQHVFQRGGAWSTEQVGSARFRGFPAGALTEGGKLHMLARGLDDTLMEVVLPAAGGSVAPVPVGTPPVKTTGSPSAITNPATNEVLVVTRSPSGDIEQLTLTADSGWKEQLIHRPAGPPPSQGTAAFTLSPVAVPEGLFARAQEGSVWFYSFKTAAWTWESGLVR